jgi:hypothetical protein
MENDEHLASERRGVLRMVDKRPSGWYWMPTSEGLIRKSGLIAGPFETKAAAIEDAHQAAITPETTGQR